MTEWRQQAASAVEAELEHARQAEEWSVLGPLRRTEDGDYLVDLRGREVRPWNDVRIAGPTGPRQGTAVPVSTAFSRGVLWLHDVGPLPPECDHVWAREASRTHELSRFARELRRVGEAPLADRLAAGRLDPAGPDAYSTCFVPGLHLVWGPPGSGKSSVAARAAATLGKIGKRVLLVTDEVLPTRLSLDAMDAERLPLQQDLAVLAQVEAELDRLDADLADYDHETFLATERRLENEQRLATLQQQLAELSKKHEDLVRDAAEAAEELRRAERSRDRVAGEHARRAEARVLTHQLEKVEERLSDLRERLHNRSLLQRGRKTDRHELRAAEDERRRLVARIDDCRRRVNTVSEDVKELDAELERVAERTRTVERAESEARARVEAVREEIARVTAEGLAGEGDELFYADCLDRELPQRHADRESLRERGRHRAALRGRFQERLWWIGERGRERRCADDARTWDSARVVIATSAEVPDVRGTFDVVLVDDAGSARLSDVLLAVAHARETAVVFGDLAQPWPQVVPPELEQRSEVARWTLATPFSHCGILTPSDAHAHPGCAVTTRQYRVGPAVQAIASHIGYSALSCAEDRRTEVVLLDTAGEPVERAALVRLIAEDGGAVLVPSDEAVAPWRAVLRDTFTVDVGTVATVTGHEFGTVVLDLTSDGWYDRVRAFLSGISRVRDTLYLLADLDAVRRAPTGTPLGAVNALHAQGGLVVRRLGEVLIPQQRQQSATDWTPTVITEPTPDGTIAG
jgi:hypothetical protein